VLDVSELSTMDATAQAELVRGKELTPLELVDAAIARIEHVNQTLNAVITSLYEDARAAAVSPDLPDGPFRGVPFLLKDIGARQKGQPYYMGNRALREASFRSPVDTPLGARFRAAGLITLGKTNLPEFGMQSTTQPLAFGATHNPSASDRSTSGSSGRFVHGGGSRNSCYRPCQRRRRVDPPASRMVWTGWAEAVARSHQ
jgi:amidase